MLGAYLGGETMTEWGQRRRELVETPALTEKLLLRGYLTESSSLRGGQIP